MSWPAYPEGYMYPNEFFEPIVWKPIMTAYTTMIAIASGLAILMGLTLILNYKPLLRYLPLMGILGIASTLVLLLGPLADLRRPDQAFQIFISPHIMPSNTYPGISFIAIVAYMWPITIIVFTLVTLLVISADLLAKGGYYRILALGLKSEAEYPSYYRIARILAVILLILGLAWAFYYPGLLFTAESKLMLYNITPLLPLTYTLGALIASIFILSIASILTRIHLDNIMVKIIIVSALSIIFIKLIELLRVSFILSNIPVIDSLMRVMGGIIILTVILLILTVILGLYSLRDIRILPLASFIGFVAVILDRWVYSISVQQVSKTGIAIFPVHIDFVEALPISSLILLFLGLAVILSVILPTRSVILEKVLGGEKL